MNDMSMAAGQSRVWFRKLRGLAGNFVGVWILFGCVLVVSSVARAADSVEDDLNRQGVEARKRNDDAAALVLFRKAYDLHHSPRAAVQIGLAEVALGRWADAEVHLQEGLAAPADPWIQRNAQVLRETLARVQNQFGNLQVLGDPTGAEVVVEGKVLGTLPMAKPARVRTGECRFEVRAAGYASASRSVTIEAGIPKRETVELSASSRVAAVVAVAVTPPKDDRGGGVGGPITGPGAGPSTVPGQPDVSASPAGDSIADSRRRNARMRTVGIVLGGLGVVAVGAGVVFGLEARSAGKNNSQIGNTYDPDADTSGRRFQTLQYVGYGVGAALVAAGAISFVLGLGPDQDAGTTHATFVPLTEGGAVAGWSGTF